MLPPMRQVTSGHIAEVGMDPASDVLYVRFKTPDDKPAKVYRYIGIDRAQFRELFRSKSVGAFLNQHVRGLACERWNEAEDAWECVASAKEPAA